MALSWEEGLCLQGSRVTEILQEGMTLPGTLSGAFSTAERLKDLSCRPQVGASHWEPGLSSAPAAPTQTSTQIAAGPRCFQRADKGCSLLFLLFIIFKGTKFGVKAGSFGKLFLALERTMANWSGERVVPRLSVDSHSVQESGPLLHQAQGQRGKTGLSLTRWLRHVLRPGSSQGLILG